MFLNSTDPLTDVKIFLEALKSFSYFQRGTKKNFVDTALLIILKISQVVVSSLFGTDYLKKDD